MLLFTFIHFIPFYSFYSCGRCAAWLSFGWVLVVPGESWSTFCPFWVFQKGDEGSRSCNLGYKGKAYLAENTGCKRMTKGKNKPIKKLSSRIRIIVDIFSLLGHAVGRKLTSLCKMYVCRYFHVFLVLLYCKLVHCYEKIT